MNIDVSSINDIQSLFIHNISHGFTVFNAYSKNLLYYFIVFEIVISGLAYALYHHQYIERLFFQLLKIGLILFIIQNYIDLLNSFLKSIALINHQLNDKDSTEILLNPGKLWQYGYNFSLSLLQTAASSDGLAMPLIFTILGMGIFFAIGIFSIQVFLQLIGFYLIALTSLLILPLAVFTPLNDFLSQCVQAILKASLRLMVIIFILSIAISIWEPIKLQSFSSSMNINAPLGVLFSALLFVFASYYLPKLAASVVGKISWQNTASATTTTNSAYSLPSTVQNNVLPHSHQSSATNARETNNPFNNSLSQSTFNMTHFYRPELSTPIAPKKLINLVQGKTRLTTEKTPQEEKHYSEIKQVFYEVLAEMSEKNKKDNHPSS